MSHTAAICDLASKFTSPVQELLPRAKELNILILLPRQSKQSREVLSSYITYASLSPSLGSDFSICRPWQHTDTVSLLINDTLTAHTDSLMFTITLFCDMIASHRARIRSVRASDQAPTDASPVLMPYPPLLFKTERRLSFFLIYVII